MNSDILHYVSTFLSGPEVARLWPLVFRRDSSPWTRWISDWRRRTPNDSHSVLVLAHQLDRLDFHRAALASLNGALARSWFVLIKHHDRGGRLCEPLLLDWLNGGAVDARVSIGQEIWAQWLDMTARSRFFVLLPALCAWACGDRPLIDAVCLTLQRHDAVAAKEFLPFLGNKASPLFARLLGNEWALQWLRNHRVEASSFVTLHGDTHLLRRIFGAALRQCVECHFTGRWSVSYSILWETCNRCRQPIHIECEKYHQCWPS